MTWRWDPTLYAGSPPHYARGRVAYPQALADLVAAELGLDGSGRLLDVGCGPGSLTLLLAPFVAQATGLDPDPDMLAEAERLAVPAGVPNVRWHVLRAEDLPAGLGTLRLVTFAQSFHWMDRRRVAVAVHGMLEAGGTCVHVHATTHEGVETSDPLPDPEPPRALIADLVRRYLGPQRRRLRGDAPPARSDRVRPAPAGSPAAISLRSGERGAPPGPPGPVPRPGAPRRGAATRRRQGTCGSPSTGGGSASCGHPRPAAGAD